MHSDLAPWATIDVGYNDDRNLVLEMAYEHHNINEPIAWE